MAGQRQKFGEALFIRRVLIVLGLTAVLLLLWQLRGLLVMLFGAIVIATVFRALADGIQKWTRVPVGVAVALSVLLILGSLAALIFMFGSHIGQQARLLGQALPDAWASLEERVSAIGLGEQWKQVEAAARREGTGTFSGIGRTIVSIGSGLADFMVVLFGGIFLAAQPRFYRTGAIKLVPQAKRALVAQAMDDSERALRLWLKGQLIAMVAVGVLTGFGLWLVGLKSALVLGLIAGLLEFIPFAGPILSAIPAVLIALAVSPDLAIWVVLVYVAVQQFEGVVLQPLVQQYAVDLPGVVLLFSLIAFGTLFGTLGIILAAPLAVVTYVLVKRLYVVEALDTKTPIPGEQAAPG